MQDALTVRPAVSSDYADIDLVVTAAFRGDGEAVLVRRLRADADMAVELVAVTNAKIVGHIAFSRLSVSVDGSSVKTLALAPVAAMPGHQNSGVGSALIRAGLDQAASQGFQAVIVLGHPAYYPRFGFSAETASHLAAPFHGPAFMALELQPGALAGQAGQVAYPPAFGIDTAH